MTHIPGVPIDFDAPSEWKMARPGRKCPQCGSCSIEYRTHESSCGGYEDDQFRCAACKYSWWVDGPDA